MLWKPAFDVGLLVLDIMWLFLYCCWTLCGSCPCFCIVARHCVAHVLVFVLLFDIAWLMSLFLYCCYTLLGSCPCFCIVARHCVAHVHVFSIVVRHFVAHVHVFCIRHQLETPGNYSQLLAFYNDRKGILPSDGTSETLKAPSPGSTPSTPSRECREGRDTRDVPPELRVWTFYIYKSGMEPVRIFQEFLFEKKNPPTFKALLVYLNLYAYTIYTRCRI